MRWSEQDFRDFEARRGRPHVQPFHPPMNEAAAFARGQVKQPAMNKTEAAYAQHLEAQKAAGEILWWRWAPFRLRLADGSYYKPDFAVLERDGLLRIDETKGFWRESARVRIKVAAELFPFKFIAIKRAKNGGWEREEFS